MFLAKTRRRPRSGHGPKGHSSVSTTQAGRFDVLPLVRLGRFGTGTALCTPVIEISTERELTPAEIAERTLKAKIARLEKGRDYLQKVPDYTAQFTKQELVDGSLLDEQTIYLKCRHQPFSIYLRWLTGDTGREVLYVDGLNEGNMVVHAGGWKARLPALTISPDSSLARNRWAGATCSGVMLWIFSNIGKSSVMRVLAMGATALTRMP